MLMQLASRNSSFCTWSVHAVYSAHNACVSVGCSSAAGSTRYSCFQLLCLVNRRSRTWSSTAWFWRGNSHTQPAGFCSGLSGSVLRQNYSTSSARVNDPLTWKHVHVCSVCSDGQKMSKRKKNYPDPSLIVQNYGADALRWAKHTDDSNTNMSDLQNDHAFSFAAFTVSTNINLWTILNSPWSTVETWAYG